MTPGEAGAVATVTFEERGDKTMVVMHDLNPSKEALDGAIASGSTGGMGESFEQLNESSPWARAWDRHEVVDLAVGRLAPYYAYEN